MEHTKAGPMVSVLMTVYNRERYLAMAIESLLASTFTDWELIVVDDGSRDASVSIANEYAQKDSRIKVYVNETNLGDYPNRNRAASYATGKYLKYLDADDTIYPHGLEQLVFCMEQFPNAGYGLCSLDQDLVRPYPFELNPSETYHYNYFVKSIFHKAPLSSIIRKDSFDAVGGFSGKQHVGDFELWHILSQRYPVVLMQHGIVWSREHGDQQMNDNLTDPYVWFKYNLIQKELIQSDECPLSDGEKKIVADRIDTRSSKAILSAFRRHSWKKGMQLFHASELNVLKILKNGLLQRYN